MIIASSPTACSFPGSRPTSATWGRKSRNSCVKRLMTPGCAGPGGCFCFHEGGPMRRSPILKSRPRRSTMTPWGGSPWRSVAWRWEFRSTISPSSARSRVDDVDAARWWVFCSRMEEVWGRDDQALESLRRAVSADPRNQEAHFRLGRMMTRRGDPAGAKAHLDLAGSLRDQEAELRRELENLLRDGFDAGASNTWAGSAWRPRGRPRRVNGSSWRSGTIHIAAD